MRCFWESGHLPTLKPNGRKGEASDRRRKNWVIQWRARNTAGQAGEGLRLSLGLAGIDGRCGIARGGHRTLVERLAVMNDTDAYMRGKQAWREDVPIASNPYTKGSREWKLWCEGWSDLEEHFNERNLCIEW